MVRIVHRPENVLPKVPKGFKATAYITGLKQPRQMRRAPSGDMFLAESGAKRIRVLPTPTSGQPATMFTFAEGLEHRPYGIAFYPPGPNPEYVFVSTEGNVLRYPYRNGDLTAREKPQVIVRNLPTGHHWTRDVLFSPDGTTMLVSVGSGSNVGEKGMEEEKDRARILAFDPDGSQMRVFAYGLRNPVSLVFHPETKDLWVTVNERDGMGDNVPPDYVTRVREGGFYGWPWYYIGANPDPTKGKERPDLQSKTLIPDVLLQAHSAALGLAAYDGTQFPAEYRGNLFVALHGSWNRSRPTGFKVVRIPLNRGIPTGEYEDFATGFVLPNGNAWGRPVGVAVASDGALLVSDDGSGTIWRISYEGGSSTR
jgi:glucose/arabinose dehydrogenase